MAERVSRTCTYRFTKGAKKGKLCSTRVDVGATFCALHAKRAASKVKPTFQHVLHEVSDDSLSISDEISLGSVGEEPLSEIDILTASISTLRIRENYLKETIRKANSELEQTSKDLTINESTLLRVKDALLAKVQGKKPRATRAAIPKKIRDMVWQTYNGKVFSSPCYTCGVEMLEAMSSWHAGHVVSDADGGAPSVSNLRPICAGCNLSMKTMHMCLFVQKHGMNGRAARDPALQR